MCGEHCVNKIYCLNYIQRNNIKMNINQVEAEVRTSPSIARTLIESIKILCSSSRSRRSYAVSSRLSIYLMNDKNLHSFSASAVCRHCLLLSLLRAIDHATSIICSERWCEKEELKVNGNLWKHSAEEEKSEKSDDFLVCMCVSNNDDDGWRCCWEEIRLISLVSSETPRLSSISSFSFCFSLLLISKCFIKYFIVRWRHCVSSSWSNVKLIDISLAAASLFGLQHVSSFSPISITGMKFLMNSDKTQRQHRTRIVHGFRDIWNIPAIIFHISEYFLHWLEKFHQLEARRTKLRATQHSAHMFQIIQNVKGRRRENMPMENWLIFFFLPSRERKHEIPLRKKNLATQLFFI